jgi:hypothetical protein
MRRVSLPASSEAPIQRQENCQLVVVTAQDYGANVGSVQLESDTGALVSEADAWRYTAAGNITSVCTLPARAAPA